MNREEQQQLQSSLKSADTEEWIDLKFYRPLGLHWALLFKRMGVTPNAITIASIFLGIGAGVMFYFDSLPLTLAGIVLLVWANTYDSADGQLARLTGQKSEMGRILDGVSGDIWFFSIYLAIVLRLTPTWSVWIWLLAAAAGYSHSMQAAVADYYRNIHLFFLKGKQGSELDRADGQEELYRSLSWHGDFVQKLFLFFYKGYTVRQETATPQFQRFFRTLCLKYADGVAPESVRQTFRQKSLPLMKYTNILSFNTRAIVLCLSLLASVPWVYFVFELTVLNGLLIYMVRRHERLSDEMYRLISGE